MNIVYNEEKTIAEITPEAGYKLTDYNESADVTEYMSYEKVICASGKVALFKEISEKTANLLESEKAKELSVVDKREWKSSTATKENSEILSED